jgi:hypothetical protein
MIPYLAGLLVIAMNSNALSGDGKKSIVVPIYNEGENIDGSA